MKYILVLLLCSLPAISRLQAQVVLDSAAYPVSEIGADSLKKTTVSSSFPALPALANGSWDLSNVTDTLPVYFAWRVAGDTGYQFADSNFYTFAAYGYQGNLQSGIANSGVFEYTLKVPKSSYSLSSLTLGATDSLIIEGGIVLFSSPRTKIAFPATANSSWQSAYFYDLNFQLSYLALHDTMAPGRVRTYITEKDTVTGWGKMRVKDAGGSPSDYLSVLQVQTTIVRIDSYFLKGAPFSSLLLTALNLRQGRPDTTYEQNYYRRGELTPLAEVAFRDAAFTEPYKATTHVQRLSAAGVANVPLESNIRVYPNPAGDGIVNIGLPSVPGTWSYELFTPTGEKVAGGMLESGSNNTAQIVLPLSTPPGACYLRITNNDRPVGVKALTLRPK